MREIDKKHIEETKNKKINEMVSEELNAAYDKEQKVATVKDRELIEDPQKDTDKNIRPFMCNCLNQPNDEEADEILRNREYYEKNGTCCKLIKLRDDWENMIRDTNYQTFSYGVDNRVEEVEGITMLSMLFCSHGGLITPIDSGQSSNEEIVLIYEADKQAKVSGLSGEFGEGARKGVPVLFNFSTHEPGNFGSSTPNYYIMNHSNQYTDSDGLSRISKIPGEIEEVYAYKEGAYVTGNYRDGGCWKDR